MAYVILTEKYKTNRPALSESIYYSHQHGCFSPRAQASKFATFEDAQPMIRKLRVVAPDFFFSAVEAL